MKKGKYRPAVFVIVYSLKGGIPEYLLLKRKLHWRGWEFLKGGRKIFETDKKTIKRELLEETGLEVIRSAIKSHKYKGKFLYPTKDKKKYKLKHLGQEYSLYSAKVNKKRVFLNKNPDQEHSGSRWVSFEKAIKILTWPNQRKCLRIVDNFLKEKP